MGADFQEKTFEAESEEDLKDKYRDYVAHCAYMYGHGGYTGTFAEKPRLRIVWPEPPDYIHPSDLKEEAFDHCMRENDKWGPAFPYNLGGGRWYVAGHCSC